MAKNVKTRVPKEGPFVETARAKKIHGKTVKIGSTEVIKEAGKKPITFKKGGLHTSLDVPQGQKIPSGEMKAAIAGDRGPTAKKQALFKKNVLTGPKKSGTMNAAAQARNRRGE